MITIVSVTGQTSDDDSIVVYMDGDKIGYLAPSPNYGSLSRIIAAITNDEPDEISVKQKFTGGQAADFPNTLAEIKTWKQQE